MGTGTSLVKRNRNIRLINISKEEVLEKISDVVKLDHIEVKIVLPDTGEVIIHLSATGDTEEEAKSLIKSIVKELKERFKDKLAAAKEVETLEKSVVKLLEKYDLSISTSESCTGGLLAGRIINVAGVSEVYKEGFVTYTNKSKRKRLDVSKSTLKKYGAVSKQTAKEMAAGTALAADTDVAISVTGIAGPDGGTEEKPVGLVYIGVFLEGRVTVEEYHFSGDRQQIREKTVEEALKLAKKCIMASR